MMQNVIKPILVFLVGIGSFLFGNCEGLMIALIALIILDYVSGVICAIINKTLSSAVGAKGIAKKVFMLLIVAIANIVDLNVIKSGNPLKNIAILFYIANECISIVENAGKMGVPVPKKIMDVLAQLRTENDKKDV